MQTILTIAGFDPSSGAGITADLAVIAAHRMFGTSCITAQTVQSTLGVKAVKLSGAAWVAETLEWLVADLPPAGVKIGMLGDAATIEAVSAFLTTLVPEIPVVLDPVLRSSSGRDLLEPEALAVLRAALLPRVSWVTPNLFELGVLLGSPVETAADVETAAQELVGRYLDLTVAATGGHLASPDDLILSSSGDPEWLLGERIDTRSTHGTGCAFSTALVCALVQGLSGRDAAVAAKRFVTEALRHAEPRGGGHGPLELYWPMRPL